MAKGKEEELQTQRHSLKEEFRAQLSQLKESQIGKENKAFLWGVREHCLRYFLTAQGHQFLRIMLEDTLEAFRKNLEILGALAPGIQFLVMDACRVLMDLIEATPEQRSRYDLEVVLSKMDDKKLDQILHIDSDAPRTPDWWPPVLDKALLLFVDDGREDSLPTNPFVLSPLLDNLRSTRCRSPRGNYPGSTIIYPLPSPASAAVATEMAEGPPSTTPAQVVELPQDVRSNEPVDEEREMEQL